MSELEFYKTRKPLYLDDNTLLVKFPTSKHMNASHAEWFSQEGIPYLHTIRGYYIENSHVMLYVNDFEIPNVSAQVFVYLFEYFPTIKWIGLGCNKGNIGEAWKPKLKIYKE